MNLVFISFSVAKSNVIKEKGEFTEKDIGFFYHLFINKINELAKDYGQIIICSEGRGSLDWRRSLYPQYKRNRDESKTEDSYIMLKKEFQNIERLLSLYPTKVISVDGAEADDSIYALSTYFAELGEDVLVVSGDGDLTQLHNFNEKINIYNPIKREIVYPKPNIIEFKAIVGDPSDGISGIPRLGKKTFEKMMLNEEVFATKIKGKEEEYENLLKIVDLRKFPNDIHKNVIKQYNEKEWNEFDPKEIEIFMYNRGLVNHIQFWWNTVSEIYDALNGEKEVRNQTSDSDFEEIDIDNLLESIKGGL
jgi:5'-3' exonuclease